MKALIDSYAALIIAFIALIQPWLIAVYKRLFRQARIEFHPSQQIELGFGLAGPSVAMNGSLRAKHSDVFVTEMKVIAERLDDGEKKVFNWRAFRTPHVPTDGSMPNSIEIPSAFTVKPGSPRVANIFYASDSFARTLNETILPTFKKLNELGVNGPPDFANMSVRDVQIASSLLNAVPQLRRFSRNESKDIFWIAGSYEVSLQVSSAEAKTVGYKYSFTITDTEELLLVQNVSQLWLELAKQRPQYSYVTKPYLKE